MSKTHFIACALAVTLLLFVVLNTVSGRWTRTENASKTGWSEFGLWRQCTCSDNQVGNCKKSNEYWRTLQGFAMINIIPIYFATIVVGAQIFLFPSGNKGLFGASTGLVLLATIASIVVWVTFAAFFKKDDLCVTPQQSYQEIGFKLDWGFGIFMIEFALLLIALMMALVLTIKGANAPAPFNTVLFVVLCFTLICAAASIVGRGWMKMEQPSLLNREAGLFDNCICLKARDQDCSSRRQNQRGQQATAVMSVFFVFIGIITLLKGPALKAISGLLFGLAGVINLVLVALFGAYFNQEYCGLKLKDTQDLHWSFALQVVAVVLSFAVVGAACASAPEEEGTGEKADATEPTEQKPSEQAV